MDPQEHIHIISAGDRIHTTYPAVLDELRTVTHTFVFAEKEVYTNSARDDARKRAWKCDIRNSVDEVNAISISRKIPCALVMIDGTTFDAIRDPVLGIFNDHPNARFSFDISAGSKRLSMALFSMALWVEGDAYYAFGNSPTRRVPVPTLPARNMPADPYNLVILTILLRQQEHDREARTLVPGATLFNEARVWQTPVRNVNEPEDHEHSPAEFSRIIARLVSWNLVRDHPDPDNAREKLYSITPDGELALIVYAARMKKRSVPEAPGLTGSP